jgi:hypothetical protein
MVLGASGSPSDVGRNADFVALHKAIDGALLL